jgi:rapamycin-insensitive companion of mTOR
MYKYVKIGCELLKALLVNLEGMRFLVDSQLLQEISECMLQLDPVSNYSLTLSLSNNQMRRFQGKK